MDILNKLTELEKEAVAFGFQWKSVEQILEQIKSECVEIEACLYLPATKTSQAQLKEELGDLLHAVVSMCIYCELNLNDLLQQIQLKFAKRLKELKNITHEKGMNNLKTASSEELMNIWELAKSRVRDD